MYKPTKRFFNTVNIASRLHRNQVRKDKEETPYISHLFGVAMLLADVTEDEDVVLAGLMHDTLEDVPDYTYENLLKDCGARVADFVKNVTEEKHLPYKERKMAYLSNIKESDNQSLIISVADKLHNAMSFHSMNNNHKHDGHFILYKEILKIAESKIDKKSKEWDLVKKLKEELSHE